MRAADPARLPVNYEWSADVVTRIEEYKNQRLRRIIVGLSRMANIAVALGVAEWIAWRFHGLHSGSSETLDYIEAQWVWMIDPRYLAKQVVDDYDLLGDRIEGALGFASSLLFEVIVYSETDDPDRAGKTGQLTALARHVIPCLENFETWLIDCLKRLAALYPYDGGPSVEKAIPRSILDPEFEYDAALRIKYFNDFLEKVAPEDNAFLVNSAMLTQSGFQGTPYRVS